MAELLGRTFSRVCVCWWKGHKGWPSDIDDPFCDRCGKNLGKRGSALDLPPENPTLGG